MIFNKSLTRELTLTAIAVFIVLLAILVSTQSINLLGRAAEGQIANEAVGALIGFWAVGLFPILLILTVFISVMVVLTRLWRDHEIVVWISAGLSLQSFIWPILRFALPLSLLVGCVSLFISPWAESRSQQYAEVLKRREELSAIAPGVFKESSDNSNRVYFIESYAGKEGAAANIFFQDLTEGKSSIILAKNGHIETDNDGDRMMVLENGRRYIGMVGTANYQIMEFKRYSVMIGKSQQLIGHPNSRQSTSTPMLWHMRHQPEARSELMWRISMPISCLVLALLAIPLSYFNPRSGHTYNVILAVIAYFVYQNALTLSRNAIQHQKVHFLVMPAIHLTVLLFTWVGLMWRSRPTGYFGATLKHLFRKT